MIRRSFIVGVMLASFTLPALAAQYYVAQNATDKTCKVVAKKPDGKTWIELGAAYKTKKDADAALKAEASCKTG